MRQNRWWNVLQDVMIKSEASEQIEMIQTCWCLVSGLKSDTHLSFNQFYLINILTLNTLFKSASCKHLKVHPHSNCAIFSTPLSSLRPGRQATPAAVAFLKRPARFQDGSLWLSVGTALRTEPRPPAGVGWELDAGWWWRNVYTGHAGNSLIAYYCWLKVTTRIYSDCSMGKSFVWEHKPSSLFLAQLTRGTPHSLTQKPDARE